MKKYKFKIRQVIYIKNDPTLKNDYQQCIIRKRTIIDGEYYYQLSKVKGWKYLKNKSARKEFEKEIFNIGFRNLPRMDNWLQEDQIMKDTLNEEDVICSKNGCELVNEFLEEDEIIDLDENSTKQVELLKKLISTKRIEIQILKDVFRESIDKLEGEQNNFLYQKACLEEDDYLMKEYLLDAII